MSKDVAIPDYLKAMMASSDTAMDMESGRTAVPRISLKGMKFRFREGGEEVERLNGDLDCVIVGISPPHGTAKTFYAGKYNPDSADPPDCSSADGVSPDSWITNPVHNACVSCPNNKFGSAIGTTGKKSKACRDSRLLYVVRAEDMATQEMPKVWILTVTVSSLKSFTNYGRLLKRQGLTSTHYVITRVSFDEEVDFPKLDFTMLGFLNQDLATKSDAMAEAKEWDNTPRVEHKPAPEPAPKQERTANESVDDVLNNWN